ncbi:unnamed protein product [Ambrosiozyma monospora]|uniref:Unnamed protein product n=1 Tax=Ambrosiozyma monospora TaxID=43982 RepID=A0A9W7DDE5_AMBMO|nr:unnamed protein product [Ambrosiozyma monospora]
MDAGFKIFTVSVIMAVCSFIAGLIPLILSLSPSKLSNISKFSVGLLISTAFTLILPEGLEHTEDTSSTSTGVYILLGFVTLYLVDQFSQVLKASSSTSSFGNAFSDNDTSTFNIDDEDQERTFTNHPNSPKELIKSVFRNTNTLGLLIHSLTDGIALATTILSTEAIVDYPDSHSSNIGTGSLMPTRDNSETDPVPDDDDSFKVGIIIVAIFIHKLPTSFALTSLLLLENHTLKEVIYHLTAFSISAPIGAFITAFVVKLLFSSPDDESATNGHEFTGPLLLFSAGSFLYVGFHTLNEVMLDHHDANRNNAVGFDNSKNLKTKLVDNLLLITGMIVPLITTYVHGGED